MGLYNVVQEDINSGADHNDIWTALKDHPRVKKDITKYGDEYMQKVFNLSVTVTPPVDIPSAILSTQAPQETETLDPVIGHSPILPQPWMTENKQKAYGQMIDRGIAPQKAEQALKPISLFGKDPTDRLKLAQNLWGLQPEQTAIDLAMQLGQIAGVPVKYGFERPLSKAATEGRHETFEGWASEAGHGPIASKIIGVAFQTLSRIIFWGAIGEVINNNPMKYALGDKEAQAIKQAVDSGDYAKVAGHLRTNPKLVQKLYDVDSTRKFLNVIKQKDPKGYQNLFNAVRDMTIGPQQFPASVSAPGFSSSTQITPQNMMMQSQTGGIVPDSITRLPVDPAIMQPLQLLSPQEQFQAQLTGGLPQKEIMEGRQQQVKRLKAEPTPGFLKTAKQKLGEKLGEKQVSITEEQKQAIQPLSEIKKQELKILFNKEKLEELTTGQADTFLRKIQRQAQKVKGPQLMKELGLKKSELKGPTIQNFLSRGHKVTKYINSEKMLRLTRNKVDNEFAELSKKIKITKEDLKKTSFYDEMKKDKDAPGNEATYLKNIRGTRHVFKADKRAWKMYKILNKASEEADKLAIQLSQEFNEMAKKIGVKDKDFFAIRSFREHEGITLTSKQVKFNDWLTEKLGRAPGKGLHGLSGAKGYVKNYMSRRLDRSLLSVEEELGNRLTDFADDEQISTNVSNWMQKRRTGELKKAKKNAADLYKEYVRGVSKVIYFGDLLKNMKEEDFKKLQPGMKQAMNAYVSRLLGYPTTQAFEYQEMLNRTLSLFQQTAEITPGIKFKKEWRMSLQSTADLSRFLIDFAYVRHLGGRLKSPTKNLIQTFNNTVPELGYTWTAKGLEGFLRNGFKRAKEDGILNEFAPALFKEFEKYTAKNTWQTIKNDSLIMFQYSDQVNRAIAYEGALSKFNYFLKGYEKTKNIPKFLRRLEINRMHPRYQEDMEKVLKKGNVKEARNIFAKKIVADTQYLYTKQDAPLISSHPAGKMLWQYSSWPENYAELLIDDVQQKHWQAIARRLVLYTALGYAYKKGLLSKKSLWKKTTGLGPYQGIRRKDLVPASVAPIVDAIDLIIWPIITRDMSKQKLKKFGKKVTPLVIQDIQRAIKKKKIGELIK